ncbi:hypothetical protein MZM54_03190 [[Brevibacterium] frigoritolerans]|nr:hypothetical protein [Peribacillus frigoritolerans]
MKNKNNFIPKSAPLQPKRYINLKGSWEAHFYDELGNLFVVAFHTLPWTREKAHSISVLIQLPTHRKVLFTGRTIKSSITFLNDYLKENQTIRESYHYASVTYQKYKNQILVSGRTDLEVLHQEIHKKLRDKTNTVYLRDAYRGLSDLITIHRNHLLNPAAI